MKTNKINVKKKIKFRHSQIGFIGTKNMNERDKLRIFGEKKESVIKNTYIKKDFVNYDVVICIPTHNRYEKIYRLIKQFYSQPTKYTFKIIILNDGSTDSQYDNILKEFSEIIYMYNDIPNGKILHWYCYNQMWEHLKNIQCHAVLQMDDDFILSNNFLNNIVEIYFNEKENNNRIMAIAPHLWSFKKHSEQESWWKRLDFVDGIALIDDAVIKHMNYEMKPVSVDVVSKPGQPVQAWTQISKAIVEMNGIIFRTSNSMVYHDGNEDSKLHGDVRINGQKGVYTQKYIENI